MRRAALLALVVAAAGCGGGAAPAPAGFPDGAKVESHDLGGGWKLLWTTAAGKGYAAVERDGDPVDAGGLTVRPLGPQPGETVGAIPQVAAAMKGPAPIENTTLLVDGTPLDTKAGGLSQSDVSVYGAPASSLSSGRHVVVAAARAGESATAVAWTFTVR